MFQSAPRERGESSTNVSWSGLSPSFNPRPASGAKGDVAWVKSTSNRFQSAPRERGESADQEAK